MEYKSFEVQEFKFDEEKGTFSGYGSTFGNVDLGDDVVVKGAFKDCLSKKDLHDIDLLYSHDTKEIIGEFEEMGEDEKGLWFKGKLYLKNIARASEVHFLMLKKKLNSMSIGFRINERKFKNGVRYLKNLDLMEISVVRHPMNPQAEITGVKKMNVDEMQEIETLADIEGVLKEKGFSQKASELLISKVAELKGLSNPGEQGEEKNSGELSKEEKAEAVNALDECIKSLRKIEVK